MDEKELNQLLEEVKAEPIPAPSEGLSARVLRTIHSHSRDPEPPYPVTPIPWPLAVRFASVIAFTALGFGLIVGSVIAQPEQREDFKGAARDALSLDVFHLYERPPINSLPTYEP